MSQNLPVNNFGWIKDTFQFNEDFIKNYNEASDEGNFLEIDTDYPEKVHELHYDLPFLNEKIKTEKVEKLVVNLHNKTKQVVNIRNLDQELNHELVLKNVHIVITFNVNTDLRKKSKYDFEKNLSGQTTENVEKHRNITLVTIGIRRNYLISEPNYHTTKFFSENLLAIEMKKKKTKKKQRYL